MTDTFLTIILSFGLFSIGLIGVLFNRDSIRRLQSLLFTVMGICLAALRFGELYRQKESIVIFFITLLFIFIFLYIGSLLVIKKSEIADVKNTPTEKL